MPIGLNASVLLARAVGLEERARGLSSRASTAAILGDIAAVELEASNIRMLLTDTLREAYGDASPLGEFERRLREDAARLDELETRLRTRTQAES